LILFSRAPWPRARAAAPQVLVGELVGARLIAHSGSLINLAKQPASTVQILGAEKALFRCARDAAPAARRELARVRSRNTQLALAARLAAPPPPNVKALPPPAPPCPIVDRWLCFYPAATCSLYRALKTKHETPKYGLIYHASLIGQSQPKFKGKISRVRARRGARLNAAPGRPWLNAAPGRP
jgi:nucleolar protein 58